MRVALTLLLIAVCSIAAAPENLHRQRQNFQYSSSSKKYVNNELADENENSGYYKAQHGNMGGNFVESHNMDAEAQRQLDELKRLAEEMSQKSFGLDGSTSQQSSFRISGGHSLGGFRTGELGQQTETFGSGYRTGAVSQGQSFGSGFGSDHHGQRTQSVGRLYGSGHRISDVGQETEDIGRSRYTSGGSYNLRGGQQTEGSGHNHQHSRFYGTHTHSGKLNSLGQKAEDCDDQHTDQFTSHGVGSYVEDLEPLSKSTLNVGSLNTGLGHGQRRYYTTSYTSPVVQRTQTTRYYTTQNAGDRYSQHPSDQLTQETSYYVRRGYGKDQQVEDFGQQTVDLGQQTEDLGQQTIELGQQTEDLGQQTIELGQQTEDFGQQTFDLGQQTQDFGQQTINLGQKTEDFGQQVQTSGVPISRKPTYVGQSNSGVTSRTPYSSTVYIRYPTQTTYNKPVTTDITRTNKTQFVSVVRTEHTSKPGSINEPDLEIDTANLPTVKPVNPSLSVKPLETDSFLHMPHNKPAQPSVNLDAHMTTLDKHLDELLKLSQHIHLDKSLSDTSTTQVSYNSRRSTTPRPTRPSRVGTSYFDNQKEDLGQQTQQSGTLEWYQENQGKPKPAYNIPGESYTSSKFDSQQTDVGQQTQQIGFQVEHETQYKPSNEQALLIGQQTQQKFFSAEHNKNLETEIQTIGNRGPSSSIYLQSKPERNPSQTEKIQYFSENSDLGQQTEDLGHQTQQQVFQSQYSGKMEWNQATGSYNKPVSQTPSPQSGSSRYPTYLGQQTEDLGQQTEDLGQQSQKFEFQSQHSGNLEWDQDLGSYRKPVTPKSTLKPGTSNVPVLQNSSPQLGSSRYPTYLGQQTEDLGQQTEDLGQQSEYLGQETENLGQQSQKFDFQHSGNMEWNQDFGSHRKPVTPKSVRPEISTYPAHLGQQTEDLGQQTQKFGFESQQTGNLEWNQAAGSYNKPLSGQSSLQIGRQRYPTHVGTQVEDLGQQTEDLGQKTEYLEQHSENLGQQTQQHELFNTGIDLGQETSSFGQWNQNEESLTQQSSRDIINREKEGQLLVGNKFTNGRPLNGGTHSYSQIEEQTSDRNIDRGHQHLGVIGLDQQTLTGIQKEGDVRYVHNSYPQSQTTSGSTYNKHNQQVDSSRLQSASHSVRRGDQTLTHTSDEDKINVGQTVEHAPSTSTLGNSQSFAISGSGSANYGTDSQGILREADLLGIIGGGSGKVSGSFSQASSSSSSYSHSASGTFTGKNPTGQSSPLNSGNLQYGTQHQLEDNFDEITEKLRPHTLQHAAYAQRTEHGGHLGESTANLESQQTEDIGQQVGQFHFNSESSSSKHEEHQERSSFDIISGSGVSTNADIQLETTTPQEKRGFWGSLGHKAKNLAGKVRDSLG